MTEENIKTNNKLLIIGTIIFELIIYFLSTMFNNIELISISVILYLLILFIYIQKTKNKKSIPLFIIYSLGVILRTIYILKTDIYTRQHDVKGIYEDGHLAYIWTIFTTHHLPLTNEWQFYHPPFWHYIGASWLYINELLHINIHKSIEGLQVLTVLLSSFVILLGDNISLKLKIKDKYRYLINMILAVHPTMIILSGSINNDCLLLFMEVLVLILLINFTKKDSWTNIIYLAIATGLCVMTKANGSIMAIPILYVFIDKLIYIIKNNKDKLKEYILKIITFASISLPIGLWFQIRNIIKFNNTSIPEPGDYLYRGNYNLFQRFFSINFNELFNYANMDKDYNLPSFIIKSSVLGEYHYENISILSMCMTELNLVLIALTIAFVIKYILKEKKKNIIDTILIITFISYLISMYIFNYKYPFACSMDFRYITICLIPGIILLSKGIQKINNKSLRTILYLFTTIFIILNILFILHF